MKNNYIEFTNDFSILKEKVKIRALSDDRDENEQKKKNGEVKILTLAQIIQEIFQVLDKNNFKKTNN